MVGSNVVPGPNTRIFSSSRGNGNRDRYALCHGLILAIVGHALTIIPGTKSHDVRSADEPETEATFMYVHGALFRDLKCIRRLTLLGQPMSRSSRTPFPKSHPDLQRRTPRRPAGPALDSQQAGGPEAEEEAEQTRRDAKGLAAWSGPAFGVYGERQLLGWPVLIQHEQREPASGCESQGDT